jgi:hypothetical protein
MTSFGQMMPYLTTFKTNNAGIAIAELSLIHRSRTNYKDIRALGTRMTLIPSQINGVPLIMERNRFTVHTSTPFELDGTLYVPVAVGYDNLTTDPRDDLHIVTIPFPVETKLVQEEMNYFEDQTIITAQLVEVPPGPSQEVIPIEVIEVTPGPGQKIIPVEVIEVKQ